MKAAIITIGDEILLGQITDTNSRYIAQELASLGIETAVMYTVADSRADIINALQRALSRAELVLITGGLGPTKDDLTKKPWRIFSPPRWNLTRRYTPGWRKCSCPAAGK